MNWRAGRSGSGVGSPTGAGCKPAPNGLIAIAVILGGGWAWLEWTEYRFREAALRDAIIRGRIADGLAEAERIRNGVYGVGLAEEGGQCFVTLPEGAEDVPTIWTVGARKSRRTKRASRRWIRRAA